jgi:hypothetical protein
MTPNAKAANKNMSGLDGLGWPNPEDEPKPTKSMSDTPETDAEVNELKSATTYNMVWAEFARKLERERDEARGQLREEQRLHVKTLNERDDAERQRDKLADAVNAATVLIAAKGRHNTMLAYEGLRSALSPKNDQVEARRP